MTQPKLKYPRLCRILTYVVVLGWGLSPLFAAFLFPMPDLIRVILVFGSLIGLLYYLVRNVIVLMMMDITLATLSCYRTARKQYTLPPGRTIDAIRGSILRYGDPYDPSPIMPRPSALRYKFSMPLSVYSRGIERIVAAYEIDLLDMDTYRMIISSAKTNSNALMGKKKARFLDKEQKKKNLHRVTVIPILAHRIDPALMPSLYDLVCKQCGDEHENCIVPCIVNLEQNTCVFNSLRVPYVGFSYTAKNRGIRIIRQKILDGNWNLRGNEHYLDPIRDLNPEDSLWDFWRECHHQIVGADRETKKRFESMAEREIRADGDSLYLKWDHRGICQSIELDSERKIAKVATITNWAYPKSQPIGKKIIQKMEEHIISYYAKQEYRVEFEDPER